MHGIFETIRRYHMIDAGDHVIAGVSGGADSVCLLAALRAYRDQVPFQLTAVHVEHGLRGQESREDAAFTQELCGWFGVPCRVVHARVRELAREQGLSTEEAGRRERYRIFEEIRRECGAQRIAVAHNQNDQAETVLWNLARGSGLRGLAGIRPVRGCVIRPLLFTSRSEIERILTEEGIAWRTDRTNFEREYTRNRIRLSILPEMEQELNAQAAAHIAGAADRLRQVQDFLERMTDRAAQKCLAREEGTVVVDLECLSEQDELIRGELLRRAVEMCGGLRDFGSVHMEALVRLGGLDCGREICLPGCVRAVREAGIVRLYRARGPETAERSAARGESQRPAEMASVREESRGTAEMASACEEGRGTAEMVSACGESRETAEMASACGESREVAERSAARGESLAAAGEPAETVVEAPGTCTAGGWRIRTELLENRPEHMWEIIEEKKYTKWLSYDTIKDNILSFRTRRPGDYLVVNAQGGRKKLKDYLIDLKIPRAKRDGILLLAVGSHVLWVPGYRISEAAKVGEHTEKIIKIQLEEEK